MGNENWFAGSKKQCLELWEDSVYSAFQAFLAEEPQSGDLIPAWAGSGRFAGAGKGAASARGARVIYPLILQRGLVYLFQVYTKGDIADLSPEQKKRLRTAVEDIKNHHSR